MKFFTNHLLLAGIFSLAVSLIGAAPVDMFPPFGILAVWNLDDQVWAGCVQQDGVWSKDGIDCARITAGILTGTPPTKTKNRLVRDPNGSGPPGHEHDGSGPGGHKITSSDYEHHKERGLISSGSSVETQNRYPASAVMSRESDDLYVMSLSTDIGFCGWAHAISSEPIDVGDEICDIVSAVQGTWKCLAGTTPYTLGVPGHPDWTFFSRHTFLKATPKGWQLKFADDPQNNIFLDQATGVHFEVFWQAYY